MGNTSAIVKLFISKLFPPLINFSVFAITARILEPSDFGFVALALSIIFLASIVQAHGWRSALIKIESIDDIDVSSVFWLHIIISLLMAALICVFSVFSLFHFQSEQFNLALRVLSVTLIFDAMFQTLNSVLLKQQRFSLIAARTVIASFASAVAILVLITLGFGVWALIWAQVILSAFNFIAVFLPTYQKLMFTLSVERLKKMWTFSWYLTLSESFLLLTTHLDSLIIGTFLGVKNLGHFNVGKRLSDIISGICIGTITDVSFPIFAANQKNDETLTKSFISTLYISSLLLFPVFTLLIFEAAFLIELFLGGKWYQATVVMQSFCIIGFFVTLGIPQKNIIVLRGYSKWWFKQQVLISLIITPLTIFSATIGLYELLCVVVLAKVINCSLSLFKSTTILCMTKRQYFSAIRVGGGASITIMLLLPMLDYLFAFTGFTKFFVDVIVGCAVYASIVLLIGYKAFKEMAITIIPSANIFFNKVESKCQPYLKKG